jgi:HSP20 family protein
MLELWNPFAGLALWNDYTERPSRAMPERYAPAVDVVERADAYEITAELPGVKPENVDVKLENGILTLSGSRHFESKDERDGYHRVERRYGAFTRSFSLPNEVRGEEITAELKDGVLTVKVPKDARVLARKIPVNGAAPQIAQQGANTAEKSAA